MTILDLVESSVSRLGYIRPEFAGSLAVVLDEFAPYGPRAAALAFRQFGTPLSKLEKKALGIRANTDITVEALNAMTEKGRADPIHAAFTVAWDVMIRTHWDRQRELGSSQSDTYFVMSASSGNQDCPGCQRLHGVQADGSIFEQLPPHDCSREVCTLSPDLRIDFGAQLIRSELERRNRPPPFTLA